MTPFDLEWPNKFACSWPPTYRGVLLLMKRNLTRLRLLVLLLLAATISACGQGDPTATVVIAEATAVSTSTQTPLPPTAPPTVPPTETTAPDTATPPPSPTSPPTPTLTPAATGIPELIVRVIDADSGGPVMEATVAIFVAALNLSVIEQTGEDGLARFPNLAPGVYPVTVSAATYEEAAPVDAQVGGGENVLDFPLQRMPPPVVFAVADSGRTNLRTGPGGEFAIIRKIEFGESVEVIGRTRDQEWLLVVTNDGMEGWVAADFMSADQPIELVFIATPVATMTATPLPAINGTVVANANVRSSASTDGSIVAELPAGAVVPVLYRTQDGNWLLIRTDTGLEGWLFSASVQLDRPVEEVAVYVPTPIPSPTLDPSVTPPTPTPPPPPTRTPAPTLVPGTVPTRAPFNGFWWRDDAIKMDASVVMLGGLLDIMFASGTDAENCALFLYHYNIIVSSPIYTDIHEDWRGMYGLYEEAQREALAKNLSILEACEDLGVISELNYSLARDAVNYAHDYLVAAVQQADDLIAAGPGG